MLSPVTHGHRADSWSRTWPTAPGPFPFSPRCENSQRQASTRPTASTANGHRGGPPAARAGLVPAPVPAPVAGLTGVAGPLEEPAPVVLPGRQLVPVTA